MKEIYRVIDSNLNRVSEGIRVLEDIARFVFEYSKINTELRETRHQVRKLLSKLDDRLISARDSIADIGLEISEKSTLDAKKDIQQLLVSNFKRVEEGLRSIEESLKISNNYQESKKVENLRFKIYDIEKRFSAKIKKPTLPGGIYGITAEKFSNGRSNIEVIKKMLEGGIKVIQYREKHAQKSFYEMYRECLEIRKMTAGQDILFIINDYIELALMVEADGIHLGQDDYPIDEVKEIIPDNMILGLSTHSPKQAQEAVAKEVDYIGVGPIFSTNTKENVCDAVGPDYLEWVEDNINLPYVAIGGIKEHNIKQVLNKGAGTVAMVTAIVSANNISEKINRIKKYFK